VTKLNSVTTQTRVAKDANAASGDVGGALGALDVSFFLKKMRCIIFNDDNVSTVLKEAQRI
jgi:hypothetical protein